MPLSLIVRSQINSYVRDKRGRLLKETISQIEDIRAEEQQLTTQLEEVRAVINAIEKEVNEGGSFIGDLRENLRVRKLVQDIAETQRQIDECDMEAAAKARRNFNDQYQKEKDRETAMQTKVCLSQFLVWSILSASRSMANSRES